jgi:ABC-type transport system involved in multi-copper enzyme maturation permease subunit
MAIGPVFRFELVRTARRRRFFVARFLIGAILFVMLVWAFVSQFGWRALGLTRFSLHDLADFGYGVVASILTIQAGLVLVLAPALAASAIADERERKTLHYLLTSRLTAVEIIIGKLGARLTHVGILLASTLPVVGLLTLFGGVDPRALLWMYAGTISTAFFLTGVCVFLSVQARKVRHALSQAYAFTALWLIVVPLLSALPHFASGRWSSVEDACHQVVDWLALSSPLGLVINNRPVLFWTNPDAVYADVVVMIWIQLAVGALFTGLAAWRLRSAFRAIEGSSGAPFWRRSRSPAYRRRRPCGDDPVYWREAYGSGPTGLARVLSLFLVAAAAVAVVFGVCYLGWPAFVELREHGYLSTNPYEARQSFNIFIRGACTSLFVLWMLWLGSITAASIASEREHDTWTSLLATPLSGAEILRGKIFGCLRSTAGFGISLAALLMLGVALGAVHPVGFCFAMAALGCYVWFVTAMGMLTSLSVKSTWRALMITQGISVGIHLCCMSPLPTPMLTIGYAPFSFAEVSEIAGIGPFDSGFLPGVFIFLMFPAGPVIYAVIAYGLTRNLFGKFDRVADRPRRGSLVRAPALASSVFLPSPTERR